MSEYRLEMKGVSKSFPGVKALDNIHLNVRPGSVHALMGENGAGKSTLMKCLFGIYTMDTGEVYVDGEKMNILNPDDALHKGLAMVHQELQPVPARSIAENMFLGRYPTINFGPLKVIDHKKMESEAAKWLKEVKLNVNPNELLQTLSISQMQSVEIAKAVSMGAKIIILDEPTSSLTENEVRELRQKGVSLIYISHKMAEIREIADDITIMRDGTYVGTWEVKNISDGEIIKQMVGRELSNIYPPKNDVEKGEVILKVDNLTSIHENIFRNCSFELRRGEILGFGGLVGAGRSELMEAVFGLRSIKSGKVYMKGKEQTIARPKDAIKDGLGMITEDRRGTGILGCLSIADNVAISSLNNYLIAGIALDDGKIKRVVDENVSKLSIKTPSNKTLIQSLSGGNQQKVIIAREVTNDSDLLIAVNPTRGLDVGAIEFVHRYLVEQRNKNKAVLLVSFELDEIMNLSDRIEVIFGGQITGEVMGEDADEKELGLLMAGGKKDE